MERCIPALRFATHHAGRAPLRRSRKCSEHRGEAEKQSVSTPRQDSGVRPGGASISSENAKVLQGKAGLFHRHEMTS
jgi:hypothetical protein